jgi:hypothetical protein
MWQHLTAQTMLNWNKQIARIKFCFTTASQNRTVRSLDVALQSYQLKNPPSAGNWDLVAFFHRL